MFKRTVFRYLLLFSFIIFGIFLIFPLSTSFSQGPNAGQVMQIKVKNDLLSVKLENARIQEVLQEIAHQTGLKFEGLENAEGKVTQEFENIPLDEGLRKISQSFIMIFKKSGEKGDALRVEKVIIIAKKGMSEETPDSRLAKKSRTVSQSSRKSPSITKSRQIPPSIPKPEVKKKKASEARAKEIVKAKVKERVRAKEKVERKKKEQLASRQIERTKKQHEASKPKKKAVSPPSKAARVAKKTTPATLTKPLTPPSSVSSDLSRGEKYFKEKRWDRAMKYFKKYLEQNPSDLKIQDRYNTAQENTNQAISLYKEARRLDREEKFIDAYEYYKKSYNIYPLLYDTWERMRALKKIIKR